MELTVIITISFLISFAWLYYLKLIDLFEQEKFIHIAFTFVLGTIIPNIIYPIHSYIFAPLGISESSNLFMNFLFYVLGVGLLEEVIKAIPLIIVLLTFKMAVNEPLDFVKYICVSALGFAFGENIEYAMGYGEGVLAIRSILSVPGHMFFSALFVYGYIEYKYHNAAKSTIYKYILIAAFAHGIYDFVLDFPIKFVGIFLNIILFFLTVSAFVTILNNNLNHSPFYSPKKVIDQERIRRHMVSFYIPILALILVFTGIYRGVEKALSSYIWLTFYQLGILYVIIVRLSRFSIIPQVKRKVKFEFPFHYKPESERGDFNFLFGLLTVKGDSHNDERLSSMYEEFVRVIPLSSKNSYLQKSLEGFIEHKVFLDEQPYFILRVYFDSNKTVSKQFFLKSKTNGISHTAENHPIASINSINIEKKNLTFHEWVILKPLPKK